MLRAMRTFLLAVLFAAATGHAADYPFSYDEVQVGPGITAFIEKMDHAIVTGNTVAIVGENGVVVVDSGQHPRLTRQKIARIREITAKPVQYVVNTHWHNDHVADNWLYAEAFPGVKFVATTFTARMLDQEIAGFYVGANCQQFMRSQSQAFRDELAKGIGPDGKPLSEARAKRLRQVLADADAGIEECTEFRPRGTDIAIGDQVTLKLGKRDVEVMFLGRANTAGDAVIYVPDAKVLMTGDIVVHPFPFATQSYIGEWGRVLRKIEALDADSIVPGHGAVMHDKAYIRELASLMESIDSQARAAYKPGMTLDELRKHVDVAEFRKRIAGESAFIGANFDVAAASAVQRAWEQASGRMEPEGLPRG